MDPGEPVDILLVEDDPTDAELAQREIRKILPNAVFQRVETREDYLEAFDAFAPDLIISDFRLSRFDGLTALKLALEQAPLTPVIILTAALNEDTAVECMKSGASDYVIKEHVKRLGQAVLHALMRKKVRIEGSQAKEEREKLAAQLLGAQKHEAIGRLAGGVAHDFNNMLSVILGRVELLMAKLPPNDPLLKDILEIEKAALHSRDTTSHLLAFSRKQVIMPQVMDFNELTANTHKTLERIIGEDIALHFHPGKDLWKVKCDPGQMSQILIHLALNARDAMPRGGTLTVATENVTLSETQCLERIDCIPGDYVLVIVSDNGVGMGPEILAKLFEPFFTTKEVGQGTGLGLPMIQGAVKQNQGFIEVTSALNRGTTFQIYLPRFSEEKGSAAPHELAALTTKGTSILLVEDDPLVRELISVMLGQIGYRVSLAGTPQEALALCVQGENFSLLITDVVMPEMSGRQLSEKIKELLPKIRVLFISGYPFEEIAERVPLDGGMHFLQKPFTMRTFSRKISDVLKGG